MAAWEVACMSSLVEAGACEACRLASLEPEVLDSDILGPWAWEQCMLAWQGP